MSVCVAKDLAYRSGKIYDFLLQSRFLGKVFTYFFFFIKIKIESLGSNTVIVSDWLWRNKKLANKRPLLTNSKIYSGLSLAIFFVTS